MLAKPSSNFDAFRSVSVDCTKCRETLFRYKKKNGTKSSLVKCYIERIVADPLDILSSAGSARQEELGASWHCPGCGSGFARTARIHGKPALKLVGGKVRMSK
jgi:hypothetical protein